MTPIPAKPINELEKKTWVSNQDLILILDASTGEARVADKEELRGIGIENIEKSKSGKTTTLTFHTTDDKSYQAQLEDGDDGYTPEFKLEGTVFKWKFPSEKEWKNLFNLEDFKGKDGVSITAITDKKEWKTTTITIHKSDNSYKSFDIQDWVGIESINTSKDGKKTTIELKKTNGEKDKFFLYDGENGGNPEFQFSETHLQYRIQGEWNWKDLIPLSAIRGGTITNIEKTAGDSSSWTTDTYTITLSDGQTFNFFVYNGNDGKWSGDMLKANNLSDLTNKEQARTNLWVYSIEKITELLNGMLTSDNLNSIARTLAGLTVVPWNWSVSASIFLRHPNGRTYEFFSDGSWAFGVRDKTSDQNVMKMNTEEATFFRKINANNNRVVNVGDPTVQKDATNKQYVDSKLNTKADLVAWKVPANQLPSYVDDVLEFANRSAFPVTGEKGKIYIAINDDSQWRWTGTDYKKMVSSPWSTDAIPEWSQNLYFTDARAKGAVQSELNGKSNVGHNHTKAEVGLGNVDNTSDTQKNEATATLKNKTINGDQNTISKVNSLKNLKDNSELKLRAGNTANIPAPEAQQTGVIYFGFKQ